MKKKENAGSSPASFLASDSSSDDVLLLIDPVQEPGPGRRRASSASSPTNECEEPVRKKEVEEAEMSLPLSCNPCGSSRSQSQDGLPMSSAADTPCHTPTNMMQVVPPCTPTGAAGPTLEKQDHSATERMLMGTGISMATVQSSPAFSSKSHVHTGMRGGRSPRTATRELFNIDLDSWLEHGSSQDIIDCVHRLATSSPSDAPARTDASAVTIQTELTGDSSLQRSLDSGGSLSAASTVPTRRGKVFRSRKPSGLGLPAAIRSGPSAGPGQGSLQGASTHVDPLRTTTGNRSHGYSPTVAKMMDRADAESLKQQILRLRSRNQQLTAELQRVTSEKSSLENQLAFERAENAQEHSALLAQLDESVQVCSALRDELTVEIAKR